MRLFKPLKNIAIVLALLFVVSLVSCGSKSDKILDKALKLVKEEGWVEMELVYDDFDWIEEEFDKYDIDGDLVMMAWMEGQNFEIEIYEFENADDAKDVQEVFEDDKWSEEHASDGRYEVVRKGKVIVCGSKKMVEALTK